MVRADGSPVGARSVFLYAASNLGSLLVLGAYPTLIEPSAGLSAQSGWWSAAFAALAAASVVCGAWACRREAPVVSVAATAGSELQAAPADDGTAVTWTRRLSWVVLAAVPSSLMLGATTYFTTDVASIPLLWIAPLALYLLSFVLAFARMPRSGP